MGGRVTGALRRASCAATSRAPSAATAPKARPSVLARLLAEEIAHVLLRQRHAGLSTDQDDFGDLAGRKARVLERDAARTDRPLHQILDQRLELRPRQLDIEMLRSRRVGRDVRQVDVGLLA